MKRIAAERVVAILFQPYRDVDEVVRIVSAGSASGPREGARCGVEGPVRAKHLT
ncbi:MAG: hypothetical protein ACO1OB_32235 [Archangium sp.]